jgi:hypothetical protein
LFKGLVQFVLTEPDQRLLTKDMDSVPQRFKAMFGVKMVRGTNAHSIGSFLLKHLPQIAIPSPTKIGDNRFDGSFILGNCFGA